MWLKDMFEAYDETYHMQDKILSINRQLNYIKNIIGSSNTPDNILVPSDVEALKDISYIKIQKHPDSLTSELYTRLMEQCIAFMNDYPNTTDDRFIDELVSIFGHKQNF